MASPFSSANGKAQQHQMERGPAHVSIHAVASSLGARTSSLPTSTMMAMGGAPASPQPQQQQNQQQQHHHHHHKPRVALQGSVAQFTQRIELYRGSISTVYRAVDELSGQRVILKCYHKGKMQDKHFHKLDREIVAMQAMRGPFVVELFGWFQDEEAVWLVMEWCEGGDLFKCMMVHGGRLDEFYVCTEIIAPLLRVLEKSHAQHIMHRDIKPENIFLTKGNRLRLGDFGLAVNWTEELPFSRSGTLDYMAPEVLRNPASTMQESPHVQMAGLDQRSIQPYDEKVDVWAVGVLAYELVVGKPPFEVEDEAQTASLIMYSNDIRFPASSQQQHTALWADFVRFILVKEPAQRPGAAQAMQHPWIQHHLQSAMHKAAAQGRVSSKKALLDPLPLPAQPAPPVNTLASACTTPSKAAQQHGVPAAPPASTPVAAPRPHAAGAGASAGVQVAAPRTPQHAPIPPAHAQSAAAFTQPVMPSASRASLHLPGTSPQESSGRAAAVAAAITGAAAAAAAAPPPYSPTRAAGAAPPAATGGAASASSGGGSAASFLTAISSSSSSATFEGALQRLSTATAATLAVAAAGPPPEPSALSNSSSVASGLPPLLHSTPSAPPAALAPLPPPPLSSASLVLLHSPGAAARGVGGVGGGPPHLQVPGLRASPLSKQLHHVSSTCSSIDEGMACDAGKISNLVTPRALLHNAHATVTVTRSNGSAQASPLKGGGEHLGAPAAAAAAAAVHKARPVVPSLQRHMAAIRLPGEEGAAEGPGSGLALPSPAPAAGHKQRAVAHLKNQAWCQ